MIARPYLALAAAFGAFATVAQVVLLREVMVVLVGTELSLAVSLAAWLAGVGAGAAIGGRWAERSSAPAAAVALAAMAFVAIVAAAAVLIRLTRVVLGVEPGVVVGPGPAALLCLAALTPAALGTGLSFAPLAAAARGPARDARAAPRRAAAAVYAVEGAGAVAGGLVFTLAVAGRVPSLVALGAAGAFLAAAGAAALLADRRRAWAAACAAVAAVWLAGLAAGGWSRLDDATAAARWRSAAAVGRLVAAVESPYQRLELARHEDQYDLYSNGAPLLSFPDPWAREAPIHVAMAQLARRPRRVLLLGGGVADRVAAALAHEPAAVDYVALDPAEIAIVAPVLPDRDRRVLRDRRVRVVEADGRRFVAGAEPGAYDLVVVAAPDPVTALANRYFTREFHEACARALAADGVLAAEVGAAADFAQADAGAPAAVLYQSLRRVFAGHVAVWPGPQMRVYASRAAGVVADDPEELAERWRRLGPGVSGFSERRFESLFDPGLVAKARDRLGRIEALPNTDASPVATLYGLVLWEQRARAADEVSPLWTLGRARPWWLLAPLALLALGRAVWRRRASRPERSRDGLWATATGGLAGLALEVVLLFAYQNREGSLYAALGVLVALFMLGLAAGTLGSERVCAPRDRDRTRRWAAWVDAATIAVILATPLLATSGWLAAAGLVAAGLCTGAVFPPAVADLGRRMGPARAAGWADAADHLGAMLGALIVGLVVLPVAGLWGAALALALVKAASLAGWLSKQA